MRGQPLTLFEREKIEFFVRAKYSIRKLGRELHRDHTVIIRELGRNRDRDGTYRAASAHTRAEKRKNLPKRRKLDEDDVLRYWMLKKMHEGWSPLQISKKLKHRPDHAWMKDKTLCHETIYQYIYEGEGRYLGLYQLLIRKHKRRKERYARTSRKGKGILHMTSIKYRSKECNERSEDGHWESDSVIYRNQRSCLSVQRERHTRLIRFHRVENKSAQETTAALKMTLDEFPPCFRKSITFDRGTEGALHYELRLPYHLDTFHCDPYSSWQKGTVENGNGIIRRYLPISTNLALFSDADLQAIEEQINNRPMRCLNWMTPNEAAKKYLTHRHQETGAFKT